jgi:hypothetical protein
MHRHAHSIDPAYQVSSFATSTGTSNLRKHLFTDHLEQWVSSCDQLNIPITAKAALPQVHKFRNEPADTPLESERPEYSKNAFVDALIEFIVGDDQVSVYFERVSDLTGVQSINVVESPRLRKIFLLLRSELKESDIPGRSTIRSHIEKHYQAHMKQLEDNMAVFIN